MYKKFVVAYVSLLLLLLLVSTPFIMLLYKHSEIIDYDELVEKQTKHNAIFASSLDQNAMAYKLDLIAQKKPQVVALGSSTSMQFRKDFFAGGIGFINAGGAAASATDLFNFSQAMLAVHKPELVILGADFWWFNPTRSNPVRPIAGTLEEFNFQKVLGAAHFAWRFDNWGDLFRDIFALGNVSQHRMSGMAVMGFDGVISSDGYRPDGSRLYYQYVSGQSVSSDVQFRGSLQRIRHGANRFEYASQLDGKQYDILLDTLQFLHVHNVNTVVFLPPVAPVVATKLQAMPEKYAYISEWKQQAQQNGWFDYLSPEVIIWDQCEFIDGFHMGDVLAQRLLLDIQRRQPQLSSYLNSEGMKRNIDKFRGRVLSIFPNDGMADNFAEQDFLQLGCLKK